MRAMSRRTWRTRAVFSSWPLACWKRRLKLLLGELLELALELVLGLGADVCCLHIASSPRRVTMRVAIGSFAAARSKASRAIGARHAVELEHDAAGLDAADPEFGRALAAAHAHFGRLHRHRHVREDADPDAADALDVAGDGAARRLDLARGDAAGLDRLEAELPKLSAVPPLASPWMRPLCALRYLVRFG